jgi:hypothetical protein
MDPRSTPTPDATAPELVFVAEEDWADDVVRKTPWWAFSIAFHLAVLLVFALVAFDVRSAQSDDKVVIARVTPRKPPTIDWNKPKEKPSAVKADRPQNEAPAVEKIDPDDRWESDNDDPAREFRGAQGQSLDRDIFPVNHQMAVVGLGGGGSCPFGKRPGGLEDLIGGPPGGDGPGRKVLLATRHGLDWLARHQHPDGHWDTDGFSAACGRVIRGSCGGPGYPEYDTGNTGLALLAFLGAGYTHLSRDEFDGVRVGTVVKKGLQWLMAQQDAEGCVGGRSASKYLYNHAIAALALSEAYGLTGSGLFKQEAQKSVDFLVSARNAGTGWRYTARCGDNDTSVTGWCVMALKSAELSGLDVPRSAYEGARAWLDEATDADGRTGYNARGTGQVVVAGRNEHFADHPAMTAIALMSRIFIDRHKGDPRHRVAAGLLARDVPVWDGPRIDYYYWYYAALALFQYHGEKHTAWKAWGGAMERTLCDNQRKGDGCVHGSWDPIDRWGFEGGRVYATAINTLSLEVWYRYDNVFGNQN